MTIALKRAYDSVSRTDGRLSRLTAVPMPLFALDVQRAGRPGQPGANGSVWWVLSGAVSTSVAFFMTTVITYQRSQARKR